MMMTLYPRIIFIERPSIFLLFTLYIFNFNNEKWNCPKVIQHYKCSLFFLKFDLVCENTILQTHASMVYMVGVLVGSFVTGVISDL